MTLFGKNSGSAVPSREVPASNLIHLTQPSQFKITKQTILAPETWSLAPFFIRLFDDCHSSYPSHSMTLFGKNSGSAVPSREAPASNLIHLTQPSQFKITKQTILAPENWSLAPFC